MSNDDEFGLYDDLDDAFIQPLEKDVERQLLEKELKLVAERENEEKLKEKDQIIAALRLENEQFRKWDEEAEKNMSSLSITCKSELER
jgi:hypothetical protein